MSELTEPASPEFVWTVVSREMYSTTYIHQMQHGVLVRVRTMYRDGIAEALTFVPGPPHTQGPYR